MVLAAMLIAVAATLGAQDKAADVLKQSRAVLGGEKLAAAKTLSLEGPFRREMGNRQMQGTHVLTLQLPDRMHRSEEIEFPGGMSMERVAAIAGGTAWEDVQNRGGMGGGGMQIVMRGPPGQELNAEQVEQMRLGRLRAEMARYMLAFLGGATLQPTYVAVAESPDGKADVLEVKDDRGQAVRIFIDQQTHLPLMLQYQEVRPRINIMDGRGGGRGRGPGAGGPDGPPGGPPPGAEFGRGRGGQGRPDPEEVRRRMEAMPPPQPSLVSLFLSEYKSVDGVMIPHRLVQQVEGKPVEEWTIEKVKVNPTIKADLFEKK